MAAAGRDVRAYSVDAREEAEVGDRCEKVEREGGPIDVCLFNAGANVHKPLHETTGELFFKAWELACYAGFLVGREATRCMLRQGRGTMLFTGATASLRGGNGFSAFATAKFGLRAIAQSMARALCPQNIHVVHLILDGAVNSAAIHKRMKAQSGIAPGQIPARSLAETSSIAEAYWFAHMQTRDAWTHELDLRPSVEPW